MTDFIEKHAVLNSKITGFRKGYSTITTLLGIKDDIVHAMKKREVTLMVLADYAKAFDTVCFKFVIKKMYTLGFSKDFLKWVLSYLSNRTQFVQIDDRASTSEIIDFGIPQGSILGLMIFNLYVTDLQDNINCEGTCFQYL